MKIGIVGAGAIGGLFGFRLASAGHDVSLLARGATLAALTRDGLRLRDGDTLHSLPVRAADSPAALGRQDLVVVAVKAPALPELAPTLSPMIGPESLVLSAMNGIPWWFFDGLGWRPGNGVPGDGAPRNVAQGSAEPVIDSIDPGGVLRASFPRERTLGCVVHLSAAATGPGIVEPRMGNALIVGEPHGTSSQRLAMLAAVLRDAGFDVETSPRIQRDVWYKLWGNMTMNPLSAITNATADRILDDPLVRAFASRCMREAAAVGTAIGLPIDADPDERHAVTRKLGRLRTSMQNDVEARRPVELDALVGAVRDIARLAGVATPEIDTLFGLARLHARVLGVYPEAAATRKESSHA